MKLHLPMAVVRHGETDGVLKHVLQGQVDASENQLNAMGRKQARETACRLLTDLERRFGQNELVDFARTGKLVILTSPLTRARDTADIFLDTFQNQTGLLLQTQIEQGLREVSFGSYDGCALADIDDEHFKQLVINYRTAQNATIDWQGSGESFLDVMMRAAGLVKSLNKNFREKIILAFTHGTFISALRAVLGDRRLVRTDGMIAFRDHILAPGQSFWFDEISI